MLIHVKSLAAAREKYPWAAVIVRVHGGFRVFDWPDEYQAWRYSERAA